MKTLLASALAVLFAWPVAAQQCAPSIAAIEFHSGQHGQIIIETREGGLPDDPDFIVHWSMWLNEETGIWAVTATANGVTCMFAAGNNYAGQTLDDVLLGDAA